jgi:branched-chain amino acid transport system substrate-binding protein
MKVKRYIATAALIAGATGVAISGSATGAAARATARSAAGCDSSIAIEGPFTGPVAQLGLEQLHFAELAIANDNAANHTNITLAQDDTQLTPSIAVTKTNAIIASSAVAAVGPAGSQEVEAVGPLFGRAGMAFITGSATLPALTTSGKNPTFFRVVPYDDVQGPQDAHYIINHLHPKAVLIVDDDEAYSQGLASVMIPILKKAGIKVNHQTYNGTDTGATLANALSSLVTSQLNSSETVTVLPWQTAANAQQFGLDAKQQGKKTTIFGTDGTDSPSQFKIPGSYVSNFGPDISTSKSALDKSIVKGVAKYGPYGAFGLPTYEATDVVMKAIASVCKAGKTPSRANVLSAIRKTNIGPTANPLGIPIAFQHDGNLAGNNGYLFHINAQGKYVEISPK